jgi:hypothetical protein
MTLLDKVCKAENDAVAIKRDYPDVDIVHFTFREQRIADMKEVEVKRSIKMDFVAELGKMRISIYGNPAMAISIWSVPIKVNQTIEIIENKE